MSKGVVQRGQDNNELRDLKKAIDWKLRGGGIGASLSFFGMDMAEEKDKEKLRQAHKRIVVQCFEMIHTTLNMDDGLVEYLIANRVLTLDEGHEFLKPGLSSKEYKTYIRELLMSLSKGGVDAYTHFAFALCTKHTCRGNQEVGEKLVQMAKNEGVPFDFAPMEEAQAKSSAVSLDLSRTRVRPTTTTATTERGVDEPGTWWGSRGRTMVVAEGNRVGAFVRIWYRLEVTTD